jgi:hypothetical protein
MREFALDLGAILGPVSPITSADRDKPLPVETKAITAAGADGARDRPAQPSARSGRSTAGPRASSRCRADRCRPVQRKRRHHTGRSRWHGDRDRIGRGPRLVHGELARQRHRSRTTLSCGDEQKNCCRARDPKTSSSRRSANAAVRLFSTEHGTAPRHTSLHVQIEEDQPRAPFNRGTQLVHNVTRK